MTAIWTQPRSWSVGELTTAALMNQHLRDNLDWLKTPPQGVYTPPTTISITNTVMADILSPITITSAGGAFLVGMQAGMTASASTIVITFDLHVDGVSQGGTSGIHFFNGTGTSTGFNASFVFYVAAKAAGSHTFKLRAMVSGGSASILSTSSGYNAQFWVREI
jgi:hypothetical protein